MVGKEGDVIATATIATYDHSNFARMRQAQRMTDPQNKGDRK